MNQRLAIAISGTTAAAILAIGMSAAGLTPAFPGSDGQAAADSDVDVVAMAVTTEAEAETAPEPTIKPKVVYVRPAPKRETVVVTRPARGRTARSGPSRTVRSLSDRALPAPRANRHPRHEDERHEREDREDRHEYEREHQEDDD